MNDCNYFVPIIDELYVQRASDPNGTGPLAAEWKHALTFFPQRLTFIGIWRSGAVLPAPLTEANTIDIRETEAIGSGWALIGDAGCRVDLSPARGPPTHFATRSFSRTQC